MWPCGKFPKTNFLMHDIITNGIKAKVKIDIAPCKVIIESELQKLIFLGMSKSILAPSTFYIVVFFNSCCHRKSGVSDASSLDPRNMLFSSPTASAGGTFDFNSPTSSRFENFIPNESPRRMPGAFNLRFCIPRFEHIRLNMHKEREASVIIASKELPIRDTLLETKLLNSAKPWATQCPREFHTEHVLLHLCQMTQLATCTRKIANSLQANMANTEQDQIQDNPVDWVDVQEKEDGLALSAHARGS